MTEEHTLSIRFALEWAFGTEYARIELPSEPFREARASFGTEYLMMQRARLGNVRIDTSPGRSRPADDADYLADLVSSIPEALGGVGMAIMVAEYARMNAVPDWMPGAVPKLVPQEWRNTNQHGRRAKTEVLRRYKVAHKYPHPKDRRRRITKLVNVVEDWCPCTWEVSRQEIDSAREFYSKWRACLENVRDRALEGGQLEKIKLNTALPPNEPWRQGV